MTRFELVSGIIACVIVAAIGAWVLYVRLYKKQELAQQHRMYAGIGLSAALGLFFLAMPAAIWVKALGMALAVVMLVSAIRQSDPKVQERLAAQRKAKDRDKKDKDKPKARRTAAQSYMPYYKLRQQKHRRSK